MELREMASLFGKSMRQVAAASEQKFGFGGNGKGYAGNRGQRKNSEDDLYPTAKTFGADAVSFTKLAFRPSH